MIATGFGVLLDDTMSAADLQAWGWRIPFAFGLLIGPVGYYIRSNWRRRRNFRDAAAAAPRCAICSRPMGSGPADIGAVVSTSSQYMLVYMPTYAIRELHLPQSLGFTAAVAAAALQTVVVPFVGIWVDRVGQRARHAGRCDPCSCSPSYPAFVLLDAHASLGVLMPDGVLDRAVEVLLSRRAAVATWPKSFRRRRASAACRLRTISACRSSAALLLSSPNR